MPTLLVGHAARADVDVLGRFGIGKLQAHFGEIRAAQQQLGAPQLLGVYVCRYVVAFDDAVHGFQLGQGFQLDIGILVQHQVVEHVVFVCKRLGQVGIQLRAQLSFDALEFGVGIA